MTGQVKLTNNAYTTLAVGCTAVATAITVTSSATFPTVTTASANWFYACFQDSFANLEIVKVTDVTGSVWTVVRGIGGTTPLAFASGTVVELRLTAETLTDLVAAPGVATGGGNDTLFVENDCVVTASYTIGQGALINGTGVTITIGTPALFTLVNHGFSIGQQIHFSTTGTLPTGVDATNVFYVISTGFSTSGFQVSTTYGGAAVATSGGQSGVHSVGKVKNASAAGPITILDTMTVTVPTGAAWVVV